MDFVLWIPIDFPYNFFFVSFKIRRKQITEFNSNYSGVLSLKLSGRRYFIWNLNICGFLAVFLYFIAYRPSLF